MLQFIFKRCLLAVMVVLTVSIATFLLLNTSTDPAAAIAGEDAEQAVIEAIRIQYGFDRPLIVQYGSWIGGLAQGDFGDSYYWKRPVLDLFIERAPVTIKLALSALSISIVVGLVLGVLAARRPDGWVDRLALAVGTSAQAIPNFWLGLMMIILFAVMVPIFPVSGDETWLHYVLPAFVLGMSTVPQVLRLTRAGMIEVLGADYIRTARAKGFMPGQVMLRHALRNALLPVVSVIAIQLGYKLGGSLITETIFSMNGLGRLAYESILGADVPTIQMLVFMFSLIFIILTTLSETLNAWLDPRIRVG